MNHNMTSNFFWLAPKQDCMLRILSHGLLYIAKLSIIHGFNQDKILMIPKTESSNLNLCLWCLFVNDPWSNWLLVNQQGVLKCPDRNPLVISFKAWYLHRYVKHILVENWCTYEFSLKSFDETIIRFIHLLIYRLFKPKHGFGTIFRYNS